MMKLDLGQAWNDATAMLSANRQVLLVLGGIFFFLPSLLSGIVVPQVPPPAGYEEAQMSAYLEANNAHVMQWWWMYLLVIAALILGYLAILTLLRDPRRLSVGSSIGQALAALLPAIGAYVLFSLVLGAIVTVLLLLTAATGGIGGIITVPLMIFAVIYLSVRASMSAPVIAVEGQRNPVAVLKRSWALTKGNAGRLLAFYLLLGIAYIVLAVVIGGVLSLLAALFPPSAGALLLGIVGGLIGTVFTVIMLCVIAAVHRRLSGRSDADLKEMFE